MATPSFPNNVPALNSSNQPIWCLQPQFTDKLIGWILKITALTSILIVALIFFYIGSEAAPFLSDNHMGLEGLLTGKWNPASSVDKQYGLLPLVNGSLLVTIIAGLVAVPVSLAAATYIAEIAGPTENSILKPIIELLAGIPSVVIGFFGLMVLAPAVKAVFGLPSGLNALSAGLLLALMAMPTMISISEDALRSVPNAFREASVALGASKIETIFFVVLPAGLPGITAAMLLGLGRVIGETMAVLMVTGNAPILTLSPLESVRTMTATVAAEMGEVPFGSEHYHALFCVGVTLLFATFLLNMSAQAILRRFQTH
ncbi:MAG: phosphate ABC transporter permease subunit PstC [Cyanobacteria bacterium HKST-UBA06]|nr:phosphate ABC transporter permease subunit PstC [Cyanobacteria bacterium HKST-UBA04]MCA9808130.1 phosphate ABC transporter permease subunit PstC [Cyanobacteria bacterium HKST-UBA06]MCA9842773.1 phosphate ABC transporter permease subunit PstC [Cyanobacteria bacterium HKST-UBA03]